MQEPILSAKLYQNKQTKNVLNETTKTDGNLKLQRLGSSRWAWTIHWHINFPINLCHFLHMHFFPFEIRFEIVVFNFSPWFLFISFLCFSRDRNRRLMHALYMFLLFKKSKDKTFAYSSMCFVLDSCFGYTIAVASSNNLSTHIQFAWKVKCSCENDGNRNRNRVIAFLSSKRIIFRW